MRSLISGRLNAALVEEYVIKNNQISNNNEALISVLMNRSRVRTPANVLLK